MGNHDIWNESKFALLQLFADGDAGDAGADGAADDKVDKSDGDVDDPAAEKNKLEGKRTYTDEDVDKIINRKFAEWQQKQQKAVDEAKRLAEMSAQEKAEYERDQLQKQLDDYKRKDSLAEMTKTARKLLADANISVPDELLAAMVTTDAEQTKAAIDGFAKSFNDAVESVVKERLKGNPPRRGSGGGGAPMTKEQIMQIRDTELRQQKMIENKELFNF